MCTRSMRLTAACQRCLNVQASSSEEEDAGADGDIRHPVSDGLTYA